MIEATQPTDSDQSVHVVCERRSKYNQPISLGYIRAARKHGALFPINSLYERTAHEFMRIYLALIDHTFPIVLK